jgi:hypothetical protein
MDQQPAMVQSSATVPRLVNFSGKALDEHGKPMSGWGIATNVQSIGGFENERVAK